MGGTPRRVLETPDGGPSGDPTPDGEEQETYLPGSLHGHLYKLHATLLRTRIPFQPLPLGLS
eukprot:5553750-Prorocentrum_lima.AAC.1